MMVFPKEFFEKVDFEKYPQTTKNVKNYPQCKTFLMVSDGESNSAKICWTSHWSSS